MKTQEKKGPKSRQRLLSGNTSVSSNNGSNRSRSNNRSILSGRKFSSKMKNFKKKPKPKNEYFTTPIKLKKKKDKKTRGECFQISELLHEGLARA